VNEQTVRDMLFSGVGAIAIAIMPLGLCIGLIVLDEAAPTAVFVLALVALGFLSIGGVWASRKITFSSDALTAKSWVGERIIRMEEVASIRVRRGAIVTSQLAAASASLVVRGGQGSTVTVNLGSKQVIDIARPWVAQASEVLIARWRTKLAGGEAISFGKRTRLTSDRLEQGKAGIVLTNTFRIEEISGGPMGSPLLRVSQNDERIAIQGDIDNYLPLRDYLRGASGAQTRAT
jgi:hypothetical protein